MLLGIAMNYGVDMAIVFFMFAVLTQRTEVVWHVDSYSGIVQIFRTSEMIWDDSFGFPIDPMVFDSYDMISTGKEVQLVFTMNNQGEVPLPSPIGIEGATVAAISLIKNINNGLFVPHRAEIITERLVQNGASRTKAVKFIVPIVGK